MKIIFLILILLFLLTACVSSTAKTGSSFPTQLMINSQDLPQHWDVTTFTRMNVENAKSYVIELSKSKVSTEPILVQHQLSVYQTVDAAKQAFPNWEKEKIPTDEWTTPDDFDFHPKNKNDLFRMECLSEKVNQQPILFCAYLQQHNNMVSLVFAKLDDKNLNFKQLIGALEILDIRLQQN